MKTITEINNDNDDDEEEHMDMANDNHSEDNNNNEGGEEESVQSVECVEFAPSSLSVKWFASGGLDKTLKIWDYTVSSQSHSACRVVCTHPASVVSLKWHTRLPVVVTAALDNNIRLFDARTGTI